MEPINFELYKGKSFNDLCKDIVKNQYSRKEQIEIFISELRPLVKTVNDAMIIIPLIKQYIDAGISNDEHLLKLAQICQRIMSASKSNELEGDGFVLTEEEKKELWSTVQEIKESDSVVVKPIPKNSTNNKE